MDNVYEVIARALATMRQTFGEEIFAQPSRFMAGINDIVAADAKTAKHLLRIAICDLHAFTRLKKAFDEKNTFVAKHIKTEMAKHYMIPPDVADEVIECVAIFVGFAPTPKEPGAPQESAPAPSAKPQPSYVPNPVPIKPKAIKIPKFPTGAARSSPRKLAPKPPVSFANGAPKPVPSLSPSPSAKIKIGASFRFGNLDWRVLDVDENKALLLSEKILDTRWYHGRNTSIAWVSCDIRQHLNGAFYKSFSHDEQFRIVKTKVLNDRNPWFGTAGTASTADRVFLLSISEMLKYFGDSGGLNKRPQNAGHIDDRYNKARIAADLGGAPGWWWLRSPGYIPNRVAFVAANGALYLYGSQVRSDSGTGGGVRPAMWVEV